MHKDNAPAVAMFCGNTSSYSSLFVESWVSALVGAVDN